MRQRIALVVLPASILAVADLSVKLAYPTDERHFHPRSGTWVALSLLLLVGAVALARVPSRSVALAAGVLFGGVAGNLVSARWSEHGVPNPLVLTGENAELAFNVADIATLLGILLLMATTIAAAIRHRDALPQETVFTRAARRLRAREG